MNEFNKNENPFLNVPSAPISESFSVKELAATHGPLEVEVGFGKGHFLLDRAEKNPEISVVGLETRRKWVDLVKSRAEKRALSNATVWLGDARSVLSRIAEDGVFQRMFIHFPDPWWKARHEKRMVITESFATQAARVLKDNAEVFIQTDVDFRARAYQNVFASHNLYFSETHEGVISENPFGSRSLREKKCEEVGLPVFRFLFKRKARLEVS